MALKIIKFFDKLEDHIRGQLSRYPIPYSIIGGIAVVLFWKGVWDTADMFPFLTGPVLTLISASVLLLTGLFVSFFVADRVILSGLKHEEKIIARTETEMKETEGIMKDILVRVERLESHILEIKEIIKK